MDKNLTYHAPESHWFQLSICSHDPLHYYTLTWKDVPDLEHTTTINMHGSICLFRHFVEMEYTNLTPADLNVHFLNVIDVQNKQYEITS